MKLKTAAKKEEVWDTEKAGADLAQGREKCTRQLVQNAKRNAKFLLSQEKTVRYIARTVFQSARTTAAKRNKAYLSGAVVWQVFLFITSNPVNPLLLHLHIYRRFEFQSAVCSKFVQQGAP